jgi:hypothetical protein
MADERELKKDDNRSRIVIETPLAPPEKPEMDRRGRISPFTKRWTDRAVGRRKDSRRA